MNDQLFCRKAKKQIKNFRTHFTGWFQTPQDCRATMGTQFILLNIKLPRISAVHLIDHLISNERWN